MVNLQLINYIKSAEAKGYTPQQLKNYLVQQGYSQIEVNEAINYANARNIYPRAAQPKYNQKVGGKPGGIKKRNILLVYILGIITFGIYLIYWTVATKIEMNKLGAKIPTAWLVIVPLANIYWLFKYCEGFAKVVKKDNNTILWFVLYIFVGIVMPAVVQSELNKFAS